MKQDVILSTNTPGNFSVLFSGKKEADMYLSPRRTLFNHRMMIKPRVSFCGHSMQSIQPSLHHVTIFCIVQTSAQKSLTQKSCRGTRHQNANASLNARVYQQTFKFSQEMHLPSYTQEHLLKAHSASRLSRKKGLSSFICNVRRNLECIA